MLNNVDKHYKFYVLMTRSLKTAAFLCCDACMVWQMVTIRVEILGTLRFVTNFHLVQGPSFIVVRSSASYSMCTGAKAAGAWN